ncbi:hypothetical protein J9896_08915 [Acinetobacter baumannii]|uniref:hypothetical protein n=1 Tax=Acinetobacter baumannii TaxID=470 RepID=UPI001B335139|nr:hypothetical protein [Acinetobacter baumannii]MBP4063521.1 hypothetical protein [Acinetobacter baumannii]
MAVVIQSNNVYTGNKALPNIIDSITVTASKTQFLKKLYATINGDTAYITDANSDVLFDTLKAHRTRVLADGGLIPSLANTLRAIIFANQNSLTTANYSAFAADFGIKLVGNTVTKLYDISGRDMKVSSGTFERATDAGFNVLKNTATSTLISETYILGSQGMILGSSLHDADAGSSSSQAVKGMYMSDNAGGTGIGLGYLECNQGGFSRLYYKRPSDNQMTSISYDQVGNYKKYSGLVGLISNQSSRAEIYENGNLKSGASATWIDATATNIYPTISALSLNSFIRESWIIRSSAQNLAMLLSNYLNKSV